MNTELVKNLQEAHLAVWNERNRLKRDEMITEIYADNIKMYDPTFILSGTKEVSDFIDKVQTDPKFEFKAIKPIDFTQNGARLFWSIITAQGELNGMDFFIFENEKVAHLYVFIEAK